jgi:hypothetical protein
MMSYTLHGIRHWPCRSKRTCYPQESSQACRHFSRTVSDRSQTVKPHSPINAGLQNFKGRFQIDHSSAHDIKHIKHIKWCLPQPVGIRRFVIRKEGCRTRGQHAHMFHMLYMTSVCRLIRTRRLRLAMCYICNNICMQRSASLQMCCPHDLCTRTNNQTTYNPLRASSELADALPAGCVNTLSASFIRVMQTSYNM